MPVRTLTAAGALVVLIGVPLAAETWAGARLDGSVRNAVGHLAPGTTITRVEPHGRPFLASLLQGEVSSAYADVQDPGGTTTLILQRLHRDTGRINTVLWFARLPQPHGLAPVLTPGGAYTPRGTIRLDNKQVEVSYEATIDAGQVSVRPRTVVTEGHPEDVRALPAGWQPALALQPAHVPAVGQLAVRAVSVGENDITVELRQTGADTSGPSRARP